MKLSIIIPSYNEQRTIKELIKSVQAVSYGMDYEIILIDDASKDWTLEKAAFLKRQSKENNIRIFRNFINKGKGFSIRKGIRRAKGDLIVVQDADTEYSPADIPKLLEPLVKGEVDVVYGSRFLGRSRPEGMAPANWLANKMLTLMTNLFFGLVLTDMETCYKVFRADIIKSLPLRANRFTFEPEVTALLALKRVRIVERPIGYNGRTALKGKKIKARDFIFAILMLIRYRLFPVSGGKKGPGVLVRK